MAPRPCRETRCCDPVLEEGQDEDDGYAQLERLQHEFGIDGEAVIGASYSDLLQQAD